MRLLIAEDNEKLLKSLLHLFEVNHYLADGAANGLQAKEMALKGHYDGLILDVMMPGLDGFSLLKDLRDKNVTLPVLILSARAETDDRIHGLNLGADDYLPKPFSSEELLARVKAMLRRREQFSPDNQRAGDLMLDRAGMQLVYRDKSILLNRLEFHLMEALMEDLVSIHSAEELLDRAWKDRGDGNPKALAVHLSNLRRALKALRAPFVIRSIRGQGYRLEESDD